MTYSHGSLLYPISQGNGRNIPFKTLLLKVTQIRVLIGMKARVTTFLLLDENCTGFVSKQRDVNR